jgi:hypothetical protein
MSILAVSVSVMTLASAGFIIAFKRYMKKVNTEVVDVI